MARVWAFVFLLLTSSAGAADLNVRDFGAKGDQKADDTAAFQKAFDEAGKQQGTAVFAPVGNYLIEGHLTIPAGVTLKGVWEIPTASTQMRGTTLLATEGAGDENGTPFITVNSNSTIKGITIFYPNQKPEQDKPTPYPWTIQAARSDNASVLDCLIVNPYKMINMTWAGRHYIARIYGQPLYRGIYVDECYDIGRVENCHLWPFFTGWLPQYKKLNDWQQKNAIAFEFARTDWQYVFNTFCFGYGVGYKFSQSKAGPCNGNFSGLGADCCVRAVLVEAVQPPGLLITNGQFVGAWGSSNSVTMEIGEKVNGKVGLTNCSFWGPIDRCIWQRGDKAQLGVSNCQFVNWDNSGVANACIQIDRGTANIFGNTFGQGTTCVSIGKTVKSAILTANQAPEGFTVENKAGARTILSANQPTLIQTNPAALKNYIVDIGQTGDSRFVKGFHNAETMPSTLKDLSMRWSGQKPSLHLPAVPGLTYTLTVELSIPKQAILPSAGIYQGSRLVIPFTNECSLKASGTVTAPTTGRIDLTLKLNPWLPSKTIPDSRDDRTLGVALYSITAKAVGAKGKAFVMTK